MDIQPQFPPHRRQDPKHNSEAPELGFRIRIEGTHRFDLKVKGGRYSVKECSREPRAEG